VGKSSPELRKRDNIVEALNMLGLRELILQCLDFDVQDTA
jgi:hypothetical protein